MCRVWFNSRTKRQIRYIGCHQCSHTLHTDNILHVIYQIILEHLHSDNRPLLPRASSFAYAHWRTRSSNPSSALSSRWQSRWRTLCENFSCDSSAGEEKRKSNRWVRTYGTSSMQYLCVCSKHQWWRDEQDAEHINGKYFIFFYFWSRD